MSEYIKKEIMGEWEDATNTLVEYFVTKNFGENTEWDWVARNVGEVVFVNDYYFNFNEIVDFLKYNYTTKEILGYYDYSVDCRLHKKSPINIRNFRSANIILPN
jgi:hypothetical protein